MSADRDSLEYTHLLAKVRDAKAGGWGVLSTGEKLACALALNRADWLAEMRYTMAEAIHRVGPVWCGMLRDIEEEVAVED